MLDTYYGCYSLFPTNKAYNKYYRTWINVTVVDEDGLEEDVEAYTFILVKDQWKSEPTTNYLDEVKKTISMGEEPKKGLKLDIIRSDSLEKIDPDQCIPIKSL